MHAAVAANAVEGAKTLIDADAEVNAEDKDGWTPLHLAAAENAVEIAQALINAGAKVNRKT